MGNASRKYQTMGLNCRGVKFRAWLYFALFSFTLLTVMCVMQITMFRGYFQRMKKDDMSRISVEIGEQYNPGFTEEDEEDYIDLLQNVSRVNGIYPICVFRTTETAAGEYNLDWLLHSVDYYEQGAQIAVNGHPFAGTDFDARKRLGSAQEMMFEPSVREGRVSTMVYIARFEAREGIELFIYLESAQHINELQASVLTRQLVISIMVCIVLSLLLSVILSKSLARPVTKLTSSARRLAAGEYDVKFDSCGYGEFDELANTLNYATEEIKATDDLRKDLIANISHDLRTPLTMIKAYAEMIRDLSGDNPVKRTEHVQVILDEANRLSSLVTDILDLSRLQSNAEMLDRSVFNLSQLVLEICKRFEGMFAPYGYNLEVYVTLDGYVVADAKRIGQVLYNLIGNALNYVGEDKRILVTLAQENGKLVFRVQDHGKGIRSEDIEHIWDRYFRSAESKRTKIGSGIGLSIVKGICESHGLEYGVKSEVGKGSTFYVVFDCVEPTERAGT